MSKHHSFEEKLKYMKLLDEGYPLRQLSRETKNVRSRLYIWRKRYIYYGEEGLKRKAPHHVSESEIASIKVDLMGMADIGFQSHIGHYSLNGLVVDVQLGTVLNCAFI